MYSFDDIIGESDKIKDVVNFSKKVCNSMSPVFVYGETGTGKELIVQAIHSSSMRSREPFIAQNCAAIPENLLESIFFGVCKGAYTGAVESKGLFELAGTGTLYLDELNSMNLDFQGKLLRVLQDGKYRRIGENVTRTNRARIITSVNEKPSFLIKSNRLRRDLYYRLNVIRINIPKIDERREDIPLLVKNFILKYNKKTDANITGISEDAINILIKREYDGNIRELEHIIECAINIKREGILQVKDLDVEMDEKDTSLKKKIEEAEQRYIREALLICNYNVSKASELLKIPRQTLQYKIKKYSLTNMVKNAKI
ncbi:MAG: sigma 54-interacting transcriptional regulator [Clostridium sp.]|nr:sigma 54-interacting transcriptional regulator [Clostridium sp.]